MPDERHAFGGPWTEVKLDAISEYSKFYTTALQRQDFDLWYIDAFAGTGSRSAKKETGGILEGRPVEIVEETLEGSARRALSVDPPFRHLRLIEARASHYRSLCALTEEFSHRDVQALRGDANDILPELFASSPWVSRQSAWKQRALVFLDPYGINVRWTTIQMLAKTERADVWYLVNLKGVYQQLARDHSRLDATKRATLGEFFGGDDWEDEFYSFGPAQVDMLSLMESAPGSRSVTLEQVGEFYRKRLGRLFSYVSPPLSLRVKSLDDYFQLCCMSNNPSPAARALINRGATAVIKKHSPAFRRMSGL